mgnify:FL=1
MTEQEKRLHRCCFSGHRPEKLNEPETDIKQWLSNQIDAAIAAGYTTFISGCAMGVDIWAGQIVLQKKAQNPALHLIAATPWPGFSNRWSIDWQVQYSELLKNADLIVPVSNHYSKDVFQKRNEWMVDHSNRVIAYFNGAPGGTKNTIDYASNKGIEVITNNPNYEPKKKRERKADEPPKIDYPENIIRDIGLEAVFGKEEYTELTPDQLAGLDYIIEMLPEKERVILQLHYKDKQTLQVCGDHFGFTRQRAQQIGWRGIKKLRHPSRIVFIHDGFEKTELAIKIQCAEEMKNLIRVQKKRYPLMNEEDIVKLVFQGMLGVGHLISSQDDALAYLQHEMEPLEPDAEEPLTERVSPEWFRLNLRAAKAKGMTEADIVYWLCQSAKRKPLSFTRQNVYNFCMKLDNSDRMKAAAEKVLDENWLPSHSEQYRNAYHPAYRVLHKDFRKFKREEE